MSDLQRSGILDRIRQALRRSVPLKAPPTPPAIDEPVTRLVHMAIGLSELFATRARENHTQVKLVHVEDLLPQLTEFLRQQKCRRIALPISAFLDQLNLAPTLKEAGFEVRRATELAADEIHHIDCSITDVHCAVAEVGALVLQDTPQHPRALSLVPPIHVAILKPVDFVPDLVDLFERADLADPTRETVIITGPAHTPALKMSPLFGLTGPRILLAFVLR